MTAVRATFFVLGLSLLGLGLGLGLTGCTPGAHGGGGDQEGATPAEVPARARCGAEDVPGLLARFPGSSCPWLLVESDEAGGVVRLQSTILAEPLQFIGVLPEACQAPAVCRLGGQETSVGPVILAVLVSPNSEAPAGLFFGMVSGPSSLDFVDLWAGAGPPVMAEGTPVGPAFALAPATCGDELGFVVVRRLPAGVGISPPRSLQARAGIYQVEDGQLLPSGQTSEGCTRLSLAMP